MAKHKRSNWPRVEALLARLLEAHARAEHFGEPIDALIQARATVFDAAAAERTASEQSYLHGYGDALWQETWRKLVWKLGLAAVETATAQWPYGERPDGERNLPTHGAHFWPTGKIATDWKAL